MIMEDNKVPYIVFEGEQEIQRLADRMENM